MILPISVEEVSANLVCVCECVCVQHAVNAGNDTDLKHWFGMCVRYQSLICMC